MKKPETLEPEIIDLIMPRLSDEFNAFNLYRNAKNWCKNNGYEIAAKYYEKESNDELSHADYIMDYLTGWNVVFDVPNITQPMPQWKTLADVLQSQYDAENKLYEEYEDTSAKIFKMGEVCTFDFLQKLRQIQNESVIEVSDKINILEGVEPTKINLLLLEEQLYGE